METSLFLLHTGFIKKGTDVYSLPGGLTFLPHHSYEADERVGVIHISGDLKTGWLFVVPLDGTGYTGWIAAKDFRKSPILWVDCFHGDHGESPNFSAVAAEPGYHGAVIKATQNIAYKKEAWFIKNWKRVKAAGGSNYGKNWFRGAYHYLVIDVDPIKQADYFLKTVERAGGWDVGDFLPMVDVEEGKENVGATAAQTIDCTTKFVQRVKQVTGFDTILYAGSFIIELKIKSHMGCVGLWTARYGPLLGDKPTKMGWKVDTDGKEMGVCWGWQFAGDEDSNLPKGLPWGIEGFGKGDTSVYLGKNLQDLRDRWLIKPKKK